MNALDAINELLRLDLDVTVRGDEAKGYSRDDEGGVSKFYLNADDADRLGHAFKELSRLLRGAPP